MISQRVQVFLPNRLVSAVGAAMIRNKTVDDSPDLLLGIQVLHASKTKGEALYEYDERSIVGLNLQRGVFCKLTQESRRALAFFVSEERQFVFCEEIEHGSEDTLTSFPAPTTDECATSGHDGPDISIQGRVATL
jgi:hypothetical protein